MAYMCTCDAAMAHVSAADRAALEGFSRHLDAKNVVRWVQEMNASGAAMGVRVGIPLTLGSVCLRAGFEISNQ